ncbi:hypothetical protein FSP39_003496 [Pinctada imbricata]|uniref:Nuclear pore complex protein Nup88 n=1 Tax=Pinctada imbricata TaxID=66713 RepID=A0AA88XDI7_PINIB|nr:hypothetical protein FSP39_003496 [Pinctada imbricata]
MAAIDWRKLNRNEIFKQLRENNAKDSNKKLKSESKGIVTIQNNDLFVWDSYELKVIRFNLRDLENGNEERFQNLLCTTPPRFEVENLTFNPSGCLLALWGQEGVVVMEMPQKWGKYGDYSGGKQTVSCKSTSIAEHFFATHKATRLLQMSWHPGSETDTHITCLTSDNTLSTYNISEPESPSQIIKFGENVQEFSQSPSRKNFSAVLGDVAASFDFGTPLELVKKQRLHSSSLRPLEPDIVWPVYVVRGNGDVIMAYTDLRKNKSGAGRLGIQGPLLMYPPAEDNYGVDACTVTVLGQNPSVLVVATCQGKLHHCVVLPAGLDDNQSVQSESSWNSLTENTSLYESPTEVSLYVYESVELELSLTTNKVQTDEPIEDDFTCPIKLIKDPMYPDRYHCTHGAGVHTVVLPWLQNCQKFCSEDVNDLDPPGQDDCIVEHLVCTKPLPSSPPAPVYGIGVIKDMTLDPILLTLTCDYEFITLPLRKRLQSYTPLPLVSESPSKVHQSPLRKIYREPFHQFIAKILERKVTNPLLKSGKKTDIGQQECFQLLTRTTQIFREEYLQKQDRAQQEIQKRVRILRDLHLQQSKDLKALVTTQHVVRDNAQNLAVKCDDCQDKHQEILHRIERVMRRLQSRFPVLSSAERNMKRELETMEEQIEGFKNSLQQLKIKREYQDRQLDMEQRKNISSPVLRKAQVQQMRQILKEEGDDLSELKKRVSNLRLEAGV